VVLALHDRQLSEHGGSTGLREASLLESALARPQQLYAYGDPPPDLADLAATLAFGLARNHPFVDGNKRTAAVALETFLELNGAELEADDVEMFPVILGVAEGAVKLDEFAAWLRAHIPEKQNRIQERRRRYGGRVRRKPAKRVKPKKHARK
jgi:death-on-curing protein